MYIYKYIFIDLFTYLLTFNAACKKIHAGSMCTQTHTYIYIYLYIYLFIE